MPEVNFLVKKGLTVPKASASTPAIIFDASDPNTGIYSPGADQVAISTNGTGRLFVDASGNVKVSTGEVFNTSATGYIRVAGGDDAGSGASILAFGQSHGSAAGRLVLTAVGSESMQFGAGGAERMRLDSSGRLGLGTSSPNYQLHVTTDFAVGASGFNQQLTFGNDTIQSLLLGTGYTPLKLNPLGGNVGIGTTTPGNTLHVNGTSRFEDYIYGSTVNGKVYVIDDLAVSATKKIYFDNGSNTYIHEPSGDNLAVVVVADTLDGA